MSKLVPRQTPQLFADFIDRKEVELPEYYLPSARLVVIASASILRGLDCPPGSSAPAGWKRRGDRFWKPLYADALKLWVQRWGRFWSIERSAGGPPGEHQALVCAFSGCPIWTCGKEPAMLLAEYSHLLPRGLLAASWAPVTS
jgi:hypothetical protein